MKKGTKKIRQVWNGNKMYYVYDLDVDEHGKRKRLYADTEEDLKKKIEEAKNNKQEELNGQIPIGCRLQDYVRFYFKNIIGKIATVKINHLIKLFSNAVFNTEIDRNMDEITEEDILRFYNQILEKYLYENVLEIDDVLRNTYALANKTGAVDFDYSVIPVPQGKYEWGGAEYIMNGEEMQVLLKYCLEDNCQKYGSNELVTVFAIYTGLHFSKIVKINENDVDLDNATLMTEGRKISLSPECVEWLRKMQDEGSLHFDSDKPLFMNRKGEVASSSASIVTMMRIAKRCGFPKGINSKTLHKAYVVSELKKGVSPEELCKRFGYKQTKKITQMRDDYEMRRLLF